jgi:hypothetical protein
VQDSDTGVCIAGSDGRGDGCASALVLPPPDRRREEKKKKMQMIEKTKEEGEEGEEGKEGKEGKEGGEGGEGGEGEGEERTNAAHDVSASAGSSFQSLHGELFVYHSNQVAMCCMPATKITPVGVVVFIPGLTDGLLGCNYVSDLAVRNFSQFCPIYCLLLTTLLQYRLLSV